MADPIRDSWPQQEREPTLADLRRWRDEAAAHPDEARDVRQRRWRRRIGLLVTGAVVFLVLLYTPLAFLDVVVVLFVALALLSEGVGGPGMLGVRRRREVFLRQRGVSLREEISAPAGYDDAAWERARHRRRDESGEQMPLG